MIHKPVILPWIRNVEPQSVVDEMFSPEVAGETVKELWGSIGKLLEQENIKVMMKNRDGTEKQIDCANPSEILKETFKDIKGQEDE